MNPLFNLFSVFDGLRRPTRVRKEPWKRLHPKDNFYQSVSFFPMPFALITTVNEHGVTSIGPHSLSFPFDLIEEPSMIVVSRAGSNTAQNLRAGRTKAALHFVEFDKRWLKSIVGLGYPGIEPEEKMKDIPFEMVRSTSDEYKDDPDFPMLINDAFQVFECELDGEFKYHPHRETDPIASEDFLVLKVKNVLLKESFEEKLLGQKRFPNMPISYGFRHNDKERRFFFSSHNKPFPVHIPSPPGLEHQAIYYSANKMDPDVRFTEDACKLLVDVPKAFINVALKGIIKEAKAQGVDFVDEDFMKAFNEKRKNS